MSQTDFARTDLSPSPMVRLADLVKQYPGTDRAAVNNVALDVACGEFFGLLGPNGAGKTTLLSMLCGLRQPDSGRIEIKGQDFRHSAAAAKQLIGLVPQDLALYQNLTGRENLAFFGSMQGLQGAELNRRIDACLDIARLQTYADRRAATYSGGLKRRLNLAIGLLHEPELLILDEPTVGIDPQSRNFIFESLRHLNDAGMTIIYTTHYMEEVEQLCQRVAIMDQGEIIAVGALNDLLTGHNGDTVHLRLAAPLAADAAVISALAQLPGVRTVQCTSRQLSVTATQPLEIVGKAIEVLTTHGVETLSLSVGVMNLEQVFLQITGTSLRD